MTKPPPFEPPASLLPPPPPVARLTLLLVVLCFLSVASGGSTARCPAAQRSALISLKNGFSASSSSSKLSSWRNDSDCCTWSRVTCDNTTGEITGLDLSNCGLSGNLSTALFDLSSLRTLNLSSNNFNGLIPSEGFEKLGSLTALNLSSSGFGGQIPLVISRLTNLISLDLSQPYQVLSPLNLGSPNFRELIQNLRNLEHLNLDGVNMSARGEEWGSAVADSVPKLRFLSLSGCSLSGSLHESLSQLKSLSELHLDRNNISSDIPEFLGNLSLLTSLRLSSCKLTGSLPDAIFKLNKLRILDLSQNPNLGGELPVALGSLTLLERLLLSNCNFSGSIPSSISNFTALVHMDVSTNKFSGEIPPIDSRSNISIISLGQNNFSGYIPPSFGNLQKLTILNLQNNSIIGPIPRMLFALPLLRTLLLNQNKLSGYLQQDSVNAFSTLETIDLSGNQLQGPIPGWIHWLTGVKVLTLASNNFNGKIHLELFGELKNLSKLDLSDNAFSVDSAMSKPLFPKINTLNLANCNMTEIPAFINNSKTISYLDLSSNSLYGDVPNWIWSTGNVSLVYLNLSHNLLTGFGNHPPDLTKKSLRVIDLHSNKLMGPMLLPPESNVVVDYSVNNFTSSIPADIGLYLNSSLFFSLSRNKLNGNIPESICNAQYLQVLDLSYNELTGPIPSCFADMTSLRILNLRRNMLSGAIPSTFSEGCNLRTINLNDNQFTGILPSALLSCERLEILDLGNNQMNGPLPSWLCKLPELRVLVLRNNKFDGNLNSFDNTNFMPSLLQILDLSSNNFRGNLPSKVISYWKAMMDADKKASSPIVRYRFLNLSKLYYQDMVSVRSKGLDMALVKILTIFTSIDLSNNKFEGSIPDDLGQLTSLSVLNISYNKLTGEIPKSVGRLKWLESLDLSHNMLSGAIPPELASLTFLSALDLSYNRLTGEIPQRFQFWTFLSSSFVNNPGLCGSPLEACVDKKIPYDQIPESADGPDWNYIFVGLGFGGGLALVFGCLIICEKWRKWVNCNVDKMLWALVFSYDCILAKYWDVKVSTEDWIQGRSPEIPERRRLKHHFCIFCTRLDFISGKVSIHHVECCCGKED